MTPDRIINTRSELKSQEFLGILGIANNYIKLY